MASPAPSQMEISCGDWLRYHHVQFFVESLRPLEEYKALEARLNAFSASAGAAAEAPLSEACAAWAATGAVSSAEYSTLGRDFVRQLLHSAGWRITAHTPAVAATQSFLLASPDAAGNCFVVTALREQTETAAPAETEPFDHFASRHVQRFLTKRQGRGGVGVLAFEAPAGQGILEAILASYSEKHPALLLKQAGTQVVEGIKTYADGTRVLDVFAYYEPPAQGSAAASGTEPDQGMVLRFVEHPEGGEKLAGSILLPGLEAVAAEFPADEATCRAYADHWVSNVVDRIGFLTTLEDTLGFTPKVDFNAGVVAAGEARIESTVTGNKPIMETSPSSGGASSKGLLANQQQVYLPINNALSSAGHVHLYIEQLGQGVQHLASRVSDVPAFVARCNRYREATGEGLSFLRIPRSYYGVLTEADLLAACPELGQEAAAEALALLRSAGLADAIGAVALDASDEALQKSLAACSIAPDWLPALAVAAGRSRYKNLHTLLRDRLSDDEYLCVVRNKVLIDIQGDDVLFQIFTAPVLHRAPDEEAPFLEFIQRRCSLSGPARPGCGGFGIRNFLTLFLSIEVSKAMDAKEAARAVGDAAGEAQALAAVEVFTSQLDTSNPILTEIADAMTAEAVALEQAAAASTGSSDHAEAMAAAEHWRLQKEEGNKKLQLVSEEHRARMAKLRDQ